MATKAVVTPANLGDTIKPNAIVANKYDINIDNSSITADANGVLSATSILTSIVDSINSFDYTDENAGTTTVTKVATNVLTLDPVAQTITSTINGVASNVLDVSALYADINVDTFTWNSGTFVLTLTETDGTSTALDLSTLIPVNTVNSTTITLQGDGTTLSPLNASVIIDPATDNLVTTSGAGVKVSEADIQALHTAEVDVEDAFGVFLFSSHTDQTNN